MSTAPEPPASPQAPLTPEQQQYAAGLNELWLDVQEQSPADHVFSAHWAVHERGRQVGIAEQAEGRVRHVADLSARDRGKRIRVPGPDGSPREGELARFEVSETGAVHMFFTGGTGWLSYGLETPCTILPSSDSVTDGSV